MWGFGIGARQPKLRPKVSLEGNIYEMHSDDNKCRIYAKYDKSNTLRVLSFDSEDDHFEYYHNLNHDFFRGKGSEFYDMVYNPETDRVTIRGCNGHKLIFKVINNDTGKIVHNDPNAIRTRINANGLFSVQDFIDEALYKIKRGE